MWGFLDATDLYLKDKTTKAGGHGNYSSNAPERKPKQGGNAQFLFHIHGAGGTLSTTVVEGFLDLFWLQSRLEFFLKKFL